jgi:hypothetical protein
MDARLTFRSGVQDKDAEMAQLHAELREARAELEELRQKHAELIDSLAALTVSAHGPDGTELGSVRLLDELLRPLGDRHVQIAAPAPDVAPSEAPETWAAWLRHRGRRAARAQQGKGRAMAPGDQPQGDSLPQDDQGEREAAIAAAGAILAGPSVVVPRALLLQLTALMREAMRLLERALDEGSTGTGTGSQLTGDDRATE